MKISFVGVCLDSSGYGNFARDWVVNLHKHVVDVGVDLISWESQKPTYGTDGDIVKELSKKKIKPDINIVNTVPPFFLQHKKAGVKNVGFTMFESTKLPDSWIDACNQMDAILVPCQWNVEIFKNSGVKVPVYSTPPGIEVPELTAKIPEKPFRFLSVFQWIERKNPKALIRSYLSAFSGDDNVELVIKTYKKTKGTGEFADINREVEEIKKSVNLKHYPKIAIITDMLTKEQMADLYDSCHCLVSTHRAEGLSLPAMTAMAHGKPVIATDFSGNTEFMDGVNSYPISYTLCPVFGMDWLQNWYDGKGMWAEIDQRELMEKMVEVRSNYSEPAYRGTAARKDLKQFFNWKLKCDDLIKVLTEVMGTN